MTDTTITTHARVAWREEREKIAAELAELRKALTDAEAELAAASASASAADATHRDMLAPFKPVISQASGFARVALAPAITLRLSGYKQDAETASGKRVLAHGKRDELIRKITNHELALVQLDMALAPPAQEDAA